jgi:hypothetical protein
MDYATLTDRNDFYIPASLQQKISETRLAFLGTGLCSSIVEACVRLGFQRLHLQDFDRVEGTNLNRQSFTVDEIGMHKVEALARHVKAINPGCAVTVRTDRVDSVECVREVIAAHDVVIITTDSDRIYFDIVEHGRRTGKLVLCPLNPGFSGVVIAFSDQSAPADAVFDLSGELSDLTIAQQVLARFSDLSTLKDVGMTADAFIRRVEEQGHFPQMVIGAAATGALVLSALVDYVAGNPLRLAPQYYAFNTRQPPSSAASRRGR